jgi:NAD(P) transhydrogenase subunit alpha
VLVAFLAPLVRHDLIRDLRHKGVEAFSMDAIPRTTRAQSMDALSSQSNLAGYKSVILAADALGKIFPLMMTAAGTITPARVLILGAGVAGLLVQLVGVGRSLAGASLDDDQRPLVDEALDHVGDERDALLGVGTLPGDAEHDGRGSLMALRLAALSPPCWPAPALRPRRGGIAMS